MTKPRRSSDEERAYAARLWAAMHGECRHCGDGTVAGLDPAPDLCVMCERAGRTSVAREVERIKAGQWMLDPEPVDQAGEPGRLLDGPVRYRPSALDGRPPTG
jgi:hypothetical protein